MSTLTLSPVSKHSASRHFTSLKLCSIITLSSLVTLAACQGANEREGTIQREAHSAENPQDTHQSTHQREPRALSLSEALPEEVVAYGGSDGLAAWLLRVQSYAQGAYPNTPPFALMLPSFLSSAVGLTNPQLIDLTAPVRWFVAPPSAPHEGEAPKEEPTPRQHSRFLTLPPQHDAQTDLWRGVIVMRLRQGVGLQELEVGLGEGQWARVSGEPRFERVHPDGGDVAPTEEAHLLVTEGHLIAGNDLSLLQRVDASLLTTLSAPLSEELSVYVRVPQLRALLSERYPERLESMSDVMRAWLEAEHTSLLSLTLEAKPTLFSVHLSAEHPKGSPFSHQAVDGEEALALLPLNTQGWLITSSAFEPLKRALLELPELPAPLKLLVAPPAFAATFALNERLELSALATGGARGEREAWLKAASRALRDSVNLAQREHDAQAKAPQSKTPQAPDALLITDKPLQGDEVEALRFFHLPRLTPNDPTPSLSDWSVQLSEARVMYAPHATYATFGPRSRPRLEAWRQLSAPPQRGALLRRADLQAARPHLKSLLMSLYLAPPALTRALGEEASPPPPSAQPQAGLSVTLRALPERSVASLLLPLNVSARLVSRVLRGVPLDITKGLSPSPPSPHPSPSLNH